MLRFTEFFGRLGCGSDTTCARNCANPSQSTRALKDFLLARPFSLKVPANYPLSVSNWGCLGSLRAPLGYPQRGRHSRRGRHRCPGVWTDTAMWKSPLSRTRTPKTHATEWGSGGPGRRREQLLVIDVMHEFNVLAPINSDTCSSEGQCQP